MRRVSHPISSPLFSLLPQYHIVRGLPIDANSQRLIDITTKELQEEKQEASSL